MTDLPFISVSTVVLDGQPLERGLDLLAIAGARWVEPAYIEGYIPFDETSFSEAAAQKLARALRNAGLGLRAVSAHTDLGHPEAVEKLRRRLDFVAALGADILISNATAEHQSQGFARVIAAVQPELAARGLILALENPGHGRGALLPDGARAAAVISAFLDPHIRLNYDIGNAETYGARMGNAAEDLAAALPVAAHLHLKDVKSLGRDWQFCPVGQGDIGYGTAVPLHSIPAHMPVGIEHPIRLWRPGRGDPTRRVDVPDAPTVIAAVQSALHFVTAARTIRSDKA